MIKVNITSLKKIIKITKTNPKFCGRKQANNTVDLICKNYDKYNLNKANDLNVTEDDAFACFYATVETSIKFALEVFLFYSFALSFSIWEFFIRSLLSTSTTPY